MSSLPSPNLDDRTFEMLLADAKAHVQRVCPEWTDLGPHDPGAVLLEAFAYLTELLLYRMNRLPEKAFVEFLRLLGVRRQPPAAASVVLTFSFDRPSPDAVVIPAGTRVSASRAPQGTTPPVFTVAEEVRIAAGEVKATGTALHCELVQEDAGRGTGLLGQRFTVRRPPIIFPSGHPDDLVVGVEATEVELDPDAPVRREGDRVFRVWREVESFAQIGEDRHVYVADRLTGTVTFAPVAARLDASGKLEEAPSQRIASPGQGRAMRVWYRRRGGVDGNVPRGVLTVLKDPIPGLKVTNDEPATGGRAEESVENALVRGPEEIRSRRRAVTASDFEAIARSSNAGVARASAFTQAEVWRHARPGTVEVLLVPDLPPNARNDVGGIGIEVLRQHQTERVRGQVQSLLDQCRPLGVGCMVSWASAKPVSIIARILVSRTADAEAVKTRALTRLYRLVDPVGKADEPGWRFGDPLARSRVYYALQSEPGVLRVTDLRLEVEQIAQAVTTIATDPAQASTWYAGSGDRVHRSLNDAEGWETVGQFPGQTVSRIARHPTRPGLLAVATVSADGTSSTLHVSRTCGESWELETHTLPPIRDLAWIVRDAVPLLFLATDAGLFELALRPEATPLLVSVIESSKERAFWSVAASEGERGRWYVAAAASDPGGVFISEEGGKPGTFKASGLESEDVRVLRIQVEGTRTFLWAGIYAEGSTDPGKGCRLRELTGGDGWAVTNAGWNGGSCRDLTFSGSQVYAATHRSGVLTLDSTKADLGWKGPPLSSGLPLRGEADKLFQPIAAVAARGSVVLAATGEGVFRRRPDGVNYEHASGGDHGAELVPLPETWLFCSGQHAVEVAYG